MDELTPSQIESLPFPVFGPADTPARVSATYTSNGQIQEVAVDRRDATHRITVYSGTVEDRIGGNEFEAFAQMLWAHPSLSANDVATLSGAWPEFQHLAMQTERVAMSLVIDGVETRGVGVIIDPWWFFQARSHDYQIRVSCKGRSLDEVVLVHLYGDYITDS